MCWGLGEGTAVARADRDVSAASVISRRLAAARGRWGLGVEEAHESRGMMEQTTLTTTGRGAAHYEQIKVWEGAIAFFLSFLFFLLF